MLTIELVPKSSWYANLRSELPKEEWNTLRRACYRKAGYVCEVCGGTGDRWPVECHEVWEYDDTHKNQKLVGLIALCPSCHQVKHIGLAKVRGRLEEATEHLSKVNGWDVEKCEQYIEDQFDVWRRRSEFSWELDLSFLQDSGRIGQ